MLSRTNFPPASGGVVSPPFGAEGVGLDELGAKAGLGNGAEGGGGVFGGRVKDETGSDEVGGMGVGGCSVGSSIFLCTVLFVCLEYIWRLSYHYPLV